MIWKQLILFRNPLRRQFRIMILIFMFSIICSRPVSSRPSSDVENPSRPVSHEITDVSPQDNEDEQILTELEMEDDLNLDEYLQQDAPMEDNMDNRGPRKLDNRHSKPHHVKTGKKSISAQQAVVLREPSETIDSVPETLQDINQEDFNGTFNGDHVDNSTVTDESFIRLSQINRER